MVIELSFQNRRKIRRRVRVEVGFISIEEIIRENSELLISIIEDAREGSEYLENIKVLDE